MSSCNTLNFRIFKLRDPLYYLPVNQFNQIERRFFHFLTV